MQIGWLSLFETLLWQMSNIQISMAAMLASGQGAA